MWSRDKINNYFDSRIKWNEERACEILNYYIPRCAEWNREDKTFYFFDNGTGWKMYFAKKYLKLKDRKFWGKYTIWHGGRIREYLINKYELEGFTKEIGNCSDDWTEITFTIK